MDKTNRWYLFMFIFFLLVISICSPIMIIFYFFDILFGTKYSFFTEKTEQEKKEELPIFLMVLLSPFIILTLILTFITTFTISIIDDIIHFDKPERFINQIWA